MADEAWTIRRCLEWTERFLAGHGEQRPRLAAEWLLSAATGLARIELYTSFDRPLAHSELDIMHSSVLRRSRREPLQYITGQTSFRTITVACEPGVLIPRPETEVLVEEVLGFLDRRHEPGAWARRRRVELPWNDEVGPDVGDPGSSSSGERAEAGVAAPCAQRTDRVLEIGCGTGCISLSIAAERPGLVEIVATDIDPHAVSLAERNRDALGLSEKVLSVRQGDLVEPVAASERKTFDVLVSNPPYIPRAVMTRLPHEVTAFEPALALDGGSDGLDVYRRLLQVASTMLRSGGLIACELYEDALDDAADLARAAGLLAVNVIDDLAGRPRIVLARSPD